MIRREPKRYKYEDYWKTYRAAVEESYPYKNEQMRFTYHGIAETTHLIPDTFHSVFCETKHHEYSYEGTGFQQYEDSIPKKTIEKRALERCYDNKSKEETVMCLFGIFHDKSLFRLNYCLNKDEPFNWIKIHPIMPEKVKFEKVNKEE